jgi:hypothetical protein
LQSNGEICSMKNETYKATMQNQPSYYSVQNAEYQDEVLSPEDFDFSDYEDSEYDSLEDK